MVTAPPDGLGYTVTDASFTKLPMLNVLKAVMASLVSIGKL